jgi:4-alpha-glucanotransferase
MTGTLAATPALDHLARLAGIEDGWWDFYGEWRVVPPETKRAFLGAMNLPAEDEEQARESLRQLQTRPWRRWLEPVLILDERAPECSISVTLSAKRDHDDYQWRLDEELGIAHSGSFRPVDLRWGEENQVDGVLTHRRWLDLPATPPTGYHRLTLTAPDGQSQSMALIVAPKMAHVPPIAADAPGAWGIATQIYALRTPSDWGVGSYGALGELAAGAAKMGAATVGINPLHALFPVQPDRFSPYAPSSRIGLNIAYIDVEALPEFAECREARRMFASPGFQASLARVKGYGLIEYPDVAQTMTPMLDVLYKWFRAEHLAQDTPRAQEFKAFLAGHGAAIRPLALFEAIYETQLAAGQAYWKQWPDGLRHPASPQVAEFAQTHAERVDYFCWLQFVADQQLDAAHRAGIDAGAAIGLYRDLAVGIAGDGADAWGSQDALALGVSVGAPPDPLAPKGQDWGLVPFNPIGLRDEAYQPFIAMMAANMRHAGALRLDHAMALQRLYWVPPGVSADQGAYVRYPVDDLFRLVALESRRNRCLVIGEDLGTVPDGFRERMDRMGIFAYRVMVFEKTEDGHFRPPHRFDAQALAIVATHDLPSARGWWLGRDIDLREKLGLYPKPDQAAEERDARAKDRAALVAALAADGLLDPAFPTVPKLDDDQAVTLAKAAHAYLGGCASRLVMVQMEDVLGQDLQMNLPGTTVQHPNWRRRYGAEVNSLLGDPRMIGLAETLRPRANR